MSLHRVRDLYLRVNGTHPMSPTDDAYVRRHFVPVPDEPDFPRERVLELMAAGALPLPAYLLSDGTPMVHRDYLDPVRVVGSPAALRDWFIAQWPAAERENAEEEWSDGYLSGQYVCLWSVTPTTIRAKAAAIERIKHEVAAFGAGSGSRQRIADAVDSLDALEPPFTDYDVLRFGGPTSRQVWIEQVRSTYLAPSLPVP